jgi:glucose-1-phosphate cytidylyltransferase
VNPEYVSLLRLAILSGGKGKRLWPRTEYVPKALVTLSGRPILDHILDFYKSKGFSEAILCVGYKAHTIQEHYSPPPPGMSLHYSQAGEDAGLLERITKLLEFDAERYLISYCDTLIDLEIEGLLEKHLRHRAQATIVTAGIRNPFGIVTMNSDGLVESFVEKPTFNYYIGCFLLERSSLQFATPQMIQDRDGQGLVDFFNLLAAQGQLMAYDHAGLQITFNTESERQAAEDHLTKFHTYREEQ